MANATTMHIERLQALRPKIEELMRIGGTPGLIIGILQHGKPIFDAAYGFRDVANFLPTDDETILPVCSLTKAVTAAALGILIDEGKTTWDTLIKDILPDHNISDEVLQSELTVTNSLCRRAGMSCGDNLYLGTQIPLSPTYILMWLEMFHSRHGKQHLDQQAKRNGVSQ
jgi:CubicO group peptidase (beta-lactamase class C family)